MDRNGCSATRLTGSVRIESQGRVPRARDVDRFYRGWGGRSPLHRFELVVEQSNLLVLCDEPLEHDALRSLTLARKEVERAIRARPSFATSLVPLDAAADDAPLVRAMCDSARAWNVGPMAAVAGAIAERVARDLLEHCNTVMVENGGDIFARANDPVHFGLYTGARSPFSDRLAFTVNASAGVAVCTSSGTVGPSLSFGHADAVVAIGASAAWADAAATSIANRIQAPQDVDRVVESERERGELLGLIACCGDRLGAWGNVSLRRR